MKVKWRLRREYRNEIKNDQKNNKKKYPKNNQIVIKNKKDLHQNKNLKKSPKINHQIKNEKVCDNFYQKFNYNFIDFNYKFILVFINKIYEKKVNIIYFF